MSSENQPTGNTNLKKQDLSQLVKKYHLNLYFFFNKWKMAFLPYSIGIMCLCESKVFLNNKYRYLCLIYFPGTKL